MSEDTRFKADRRQLALKLARLQGYTGVLQHEESRLICPQLVVTGVAEVPSPFYDYQEAKRIEHVHNVLLVYHTSRIHALIPVEAGVRIDVSLGKADILDKEEAFRYLVGKALLTKLLVNNSSFSQEDAPVIGHSRFSFVETLTQNAVHGGLVTHGQYSASVVN